MARVRCTGHVSLRERFIGQVVGLRLLRGPTAF
jgi:hypothetical protein